MVWLFFLVFSFKLSVKWFSWLAYADNVERKKKKKKKNRKLEQSLLDAPIQMIFTYGSCVQIFHSDTWRMKSEEPFILCSTSHGNRVTKNADFIKDIRHNTSAAIGHSIHTENRHHLLTRRHAHSRMCKSILQSNAQQVFHFSSVRV